MQSGCFPCATIAPSLQDGLHGISCPITPQFRCDFRTSLTGWQGHYQSLNEGSTWSGEGIYFQFKLCSSAASPTQWCRSQSLWSLDQGTFRLASSRRTLWCLLTWKKSESSTGPDQVTPSHGAYAFYLYPGLHLAVPPMQSSGCNIDLESLRTAILRSAKCQHLGQVLVQCLMQELNEF